jgi:hypothetical protein
VIKGSQLTDLDSLRSSLPRGRPLGGVLDPCSRRSNQDEREQVGPADAPKVAHKLEGAVDSPPI